MRRPENNIYFLSPVGADGPIKIGCSRWVGNRLDEMCKWSPIPLEVRAYAVGDFSLERCLHRLFGDQRLWKEWFQPSEFLLSGIQRVSAGASIIDAFGIDVVEVRKWGRLTKKYHHPSFVRPKRKRVDPPSKQEKA